MKVAIVIPVGPGHESFAIAAAQSVARAWRETRGRFTDLAIDLVADCEGNLGRSAARNRGLDRNLADWYFLMDADDGMAPRAFERVDLGAPATFGTVWAMPHATLQHPLADRWPLTREDILRYGSRGALCMGFFLRGDVTVRFNKSLDLGEDYDFYLRLPGWVKINQPLVHIGYHIPSAGGPRSCQGADWIAACDRVIAQYRELVHG